MSVTGYVAATHRDNVARLLTNMAAVDPSLIARLWPPMVFGSPHLAEDP
jgi:hypothetical protein